MPVLTVATGQFPQATHVEDNPDDRVLYQVGCASC